MDPKRCERMRLLVPLAMALGGCSALPSHVHSPALYKKAVATTQASHVLTSGALFDQITARDRALEEQFLAAIADDRAKRAAVVVQKLTIPPGPKANAAAAAAAAAAHLPPPPPGGSIAAILKSAKARIDNSIVETYLESRSSSVNFLNGSTTIADLRKQVSSTAGLTTNLSANERQIKDDLLALSTGISGLQDVFGSQLVDPAGAGPSTVSFSAVGAEAAAWSARSWTKSEIDAFLARLQQVLLAAEQAFPVVATREQLIQTRDRLQLILGSHAGPPDAAPSPGQTATDQLFKPVYDDLKAAVVGGTAISGVQVPVVQGQLLSVLDAADKHLDTPVQIGTLAEGEQVQLLREQFDVKQQLATARGMLTGVAADTQPTLDEERGQLERQIADLRRRRKAFEDALGLLQAGVTTAAADVHREQRIKELKAEISDLSSKTDQASKDKLKADRDELAVLEKQSPWSQVRMAVDKVDKDGLSGISAGSSGVLAAIKSDWDGLAAKIKPLTSADAKDANPKVAPPTFFLDVLLIGVKRDADLLSEEETYAKEQAKLLSVAQRVKRRAEKAWGKANAIATHEATAATRLKAVDNDAPFRQSYLTAKRVANDAATIVTAGDPAVQPAPAGQAVPVGQPAQAKPQWDPAELSLDAQDRMRELTYLALLDLDVEVNVRAELQMVVTKMVFLDKRHETRLQEIRIRHDFEVIAAATDSLEAYHAGGLTPEDVRTAMSIVTAGGVVTIAAK